MVKRNGFSFKEWLNEHPYASQIKQFFDWAEQNEEQPAEFASLKKGRKQLETSTVYLDDLSLLMMDRNILKSPIFRPGQYFNADKLMRTAKKNALISEVLMGVAMEERPEIEEHMWYTMRLYSVFLDFYVLPLEQAKQFRPLVEKMELPPKIKIRQWIGWIFLTVILLAIILGAAVALVLSGRTAIAIVVGSVLLVGAAIWITLGLLQAFPRQFKRLKETANLVCVRGQVGDVGEGRPFSSIRFNAQAIHVSTLHDSLGKIFTYYALEPIGCKTDGTIYQIVFVDQLGLIVEAIPLKEVLQIEKEQEQ